MAGALKRFSEVALAVAFGVGLAVVACQAYDATCTQADCFDDGTGGGQDYTCDSATGFCLRACTSTTATSACLHSQFCDADATSGEGVCRATSGGGGAGGAGGAGGSGALHCTAKPVCSANSDCTTTATLDHCFNPGTATAFCGCSGDTVCTTAGMKACDPTSHLCVLCTPADQATDCTVANFATCTATGVCGCSGDAACTTGAQSCDTASGTCIACANNGDCSGTTPTCFNAGAVDSSCGCAGDSDCTGTVCDTATGKCVQCNADAECTASGFGETCDTAGHTCECASGAECTATAASGVCE